MFGIDSGEILIIAVVALVVLGPRNQGLTAADTVRGGALGFCLVVTQRRNVADTVRFVLTQPDETVIPEVLVLPMRETSWP